MSSPSMGEAFGYHDRALVSSPGLGPRGESLQGPEDVAVRPMRLKVLYTFDDLNKTNCLARWPQVLDIRSVHVDENTQIGVVDLTICVQAIVSASPELVAKLGQDYTVYAYDYSEFDTPLVGQGMLSWVLASSSVPGASDHSIKRPVTGRVCRNMLGLFSSSSQETLEVKLRLVPVPTCLQSEYIESMKTYRELSKIIPGGFDAGAWTSFLQANPSAGQMAQQTRRQGATVGLVQGEPTGFEQMPKIINEHSSRRGSVDLRYMPPTVTPSGAESLQQQPRAASPALSARSATAPSKRRGRPPRTASRTSVRERDIQPATVSGRDTTENTHEADDDRVAEGPVKKRAKVSRVERPDSTGFDKLPDSLRVAASTAASVRVYQPAALRPPVHRAPSLELPPRVPTPIADPTNIIRRSLLPKPRSSLRDQSPVAQDITYTSPYLGSDALPKPDDRGIGSLPNSPPEIPSSPPVYRGPSTAPSSPHLPTLPAHIDSGFMSGTIEGLFEGEEYQTPDHERPAIATQYSRPLDLPQANIEKKDDPPNLPSATSIVHQLPSDAACVTHGILLACAPEGSDGQNVQQPQADAQAIAHFRRAARSASGSRTLDRTLSSGILPAPSLPKNNSARPVELSRSQTWSGQQEPSSGLDPTETLRNSESLGKPKKQKKGAGANAKRKEAIQSRLQTSIEAGEMPPFCENCGAIETPTWRKAWVKVHSGKPEHVHISEEEGGIIAWETLQTDVEGNICLYRIIKRTLLPVDQGFSEILLCNPCGLWLHTRKCIRPKEQWEKPQKGPEEKRKRAPRARKPKPDLASEQNPSDRSLGGNLHSDDASSPVDDVSMENMCRETSHVVQSCKPRALSLQPSSTVDINRHTTHPNLTEFTREVRSSPPPHLTGALHTPLEVTDLTPKPTRRILFPSPRQGKESRALGETSSNLDKPGEDVGLKEDFSCCPDDDQSNKENRPPTPSEDQHFDSLFEDSQDTVLRLATPSPRNMANPDLFTTPGKAVTPERPLPFTGDFFSSAAKMLFHPTTPAQLLPKFQQTPPVGELTPFTLQVNRLLSDANTGSPSGGTSFDFSTLPYLHLSPNSHARADFDLSSFDPQDYLSTDIAIPSSPPWFGVYEDPKENDDDLWKDFQLTTSPDTRPLADGREQVLDEMAVVHKASIAVEVPEGGAQTNTSGSAVFT